MDSRIVRSDNRLAAKFVPGMVAAVLLLPACMSGAPRKAPLESTEQTSRALTAEQLVQSFALNDYKRVLDGQWQGIRYASDGNVYFGSSTHSAHHGGSFFKYDPLSGQVTLLVEDLSVLCGEDPQTNPQGKLHSDIVEANGWLYMSTHFSSELPGAYATWTGSHVLGYELATGTLRDYGVVHPNYTSYSGIGVDPARNYLYVFVTGETAGQVSYVYRIDTVTGAKTNLGEVGGSFNSSAWMFVDQRGDVWFAVRNQNGDFRRIRADTGQIDVFPGALPPLYRWDSDQVETGATEQAARGIGWMQPLDGDRALFTLGSSGGMLYMFDASKAIGSGQEFQNLRHIGYNYLGMALGGNRVFYYQRANRAFGQQEFQDFHLLSVSLDAASGYPITDHGLLKDQGGRLVWRAPGMMTDGQGRVFIVGDWWTIPGDLGTLRYKYNGGAEIYEQLPRGQFFAVANVSISAPAPTDLSITSTDSPDPIGTSALLAYTIQVTNNASTEATGVLVADTLPANVTYISATSGAGTCSKFANTVTCQLLSLGAGASATVTVTVKPLVAGTMVNTVSVSGNEYDPDTTNNSASENTTVLDTVQFSATSYTVAENGVTSTITVTRSGTGAMSVDYATGNNTAAAGSDYTATSGRLAFAVGEGPKTFTVPITIDTNAEGNESLNLTLSSPSGAVIGQNGKASLTILDDDIYTLPTLAFSVGDFAVAESTATKTVTVSRTGDVAVAVSVNWSAASNTATLGTDFTAAGGVLTFGAGVTSQSFVVNITNDTAPEGNETGRLLLSNPTGGAKLGLRPSATLTITDNDVSSSGFKFGATGYTASENGSKSITISRTSSTAAQSVTFTTSDNGTAVAGTDYTAVTSIVAFAVGELSKTVSVPILTDTIVESNESVNLTLSNPTDGGTLGALRTSVLFITDNDANGTLQFKYTSWSISESGPTATITVTRTSGTYGAIGVSYATSDNTATQGLDYTSVSGGLTFTQGQTSRTFTVPILNDPTPEGAESLNLTLSNATGGATLGQARRTVLIITDND